MFIGISQRLLLNESYYELREALALEWGAFFKTNLQGFLPLPLSYEIDFKAYAPHLKGVILSGGNDLNSLNPNELSLKRDAYESKIIAHCLKNDLPLLGICRGAQMIAWYFKSSLKPCQNHIGTHSILTKKGVFEVNSFHNFCIENLGENLKSLAVAEDKSIEAFKHKKRQIYGIMWHIEREKGLGESAIFKKWLKGVK
ncbi:MULTISPECIES: gamma-glutamyl-CDP-amidate hydrolase [Campylobacter]|uniref:gamma-glutamyl-CDP-amidate hydrolase n=1 Tax=Campylobacter TaxID=194 RepID=UPI002149FB4D|nr:MULTISPECIES: gamma-glutamyl-CDP-amidate hydrolase [Campylobacter]MCR2064281.1 gamma-glutamyl-gamma-aminobutyrate hydrolase family protein [Campylobacter helveticus]MDL0110608.1 gamma-glutamyl-gamma-aminobutyrate hydrolase family protein [Campylobacter felis]